MPENQAENKPRRTLPALIAIPPLLVLGGWLFLGAANPQWHWRLYVHQASGAPGGRLEPPPGHDGVWNNWTGEGLLASAYSYRGGKRDGPYRTFDRNGRPLASGGYADGELEGVQIISQEDGTRTEIVYRNGKRNGMEKTWFASGQLAVEAPWVDGVQEGSVIFYQPDGSLQASIPFHNGKIEGVQKTWHGNGRLQGEETYRNSLKNGPSRFWRPDGVIEMSLNYRDGAMDGVQTWHHPNGNVAREINLFQGTPQGSWREWGENGELTADEEYDRGELKTERNGAPDPSAPLTTTRGES